MWLRRAFIALLALIVHRPGGFDGDVRLTVSADYLDLFDRNAVDPDPTAAAATDDLVIWRSTHPRATR